jgi:hypothetical protein
MPNEESSEMIGMTSEPIVILHTEPDENAKPPPLPEEPVTAEPLYAQGEGVDIKALLAALRLER